MIEVSGLQHRYGPLTAVHGLDFQVRRGEVLGLLGPNGAGKSTAMRAVVGLLNPTSGTVRIGDADMAEEPLAARAQLGYLPEHVPLYRELKVREFLRFAAGAKDVSAKRIDDEVDRVIEACDLGPVAARMIGFCSRGYRQRIGLAQALVGDPPVLVLDEPTVGLDPAQIVGIRDRVEELAQDKAVLLSTHILPEAQRLCDRVLILNEGRCVAEDSPERLGEALSDAPRWRLATVGDVAGLAEAMTALEFVQSATHRGSEDGRHIWDVELRDRDAAPKLVESLVRLGTGVAELGPERLGLEDVFLRLVRQEAS